VPAAAPEPALAPKPAFPPTPALAPVPAPPVPSPPPPSLDEQPKTHDTTEASISPESLFFMEYPERRADT
jgi:hypothetical protein